MQPSRGVNNSERYLNSLCSRTFLSLWSYPNVFRDQSIDGTNREGKEICDLLVVFGNRIIIFSDKYCDFPDSGSLETDWRRWYKRAVLGSYHQVCGAARWLRQFPDRVFVDRSCTTPLPISLPRGDEVKIHFVVVAHGTAHRCRQELGGSGSLMLHFGEDRDNFPPPFSVSRFGIESGFVHVLDDFTVDAIVGTLDTISDFVDYLDAKEKLLSTGMIIYAAGEEDLLAQYMMNMEGSGRHGFNWSQVVDAIMLEEGYWEDFCLSDRNKRRVEADRESYSWDGLIEIFTHDRHERHSDSAIADIERALRGMAAERRFHRRSLSALFKNLATQDNGKSNILSRTVRPDGDGPYYLMMTMRQPDWSGREEYLGVRLSLLVELSHAVRARYPHATEVIGLATDLGPKDVSSFDVFWADLTTLTSDEVDRAVNTAKSVSLHRNFYERRSTTLEFPDPLLPGKLAKGRNRNVPCVCGSGLKYKHCCGRSIA
jgi:hypothetical protein